MTVVVRCDPVVRGPDVAPAVRSRELHALAKSDGCEHPFEHGNKRRVGVVLVHPGPGQQRGLAEVDDGHAHDEVRLDSAAAVPVLFVGGAFGAADRTGEEAFGPARGDVHQRCWAAVNGDLGHLGELGAVLGLALQVLQVVLGRGLRGVTAWG
jgi:hypothetical protein